ncbi:L,D-transpeptidase family protein [Sulfurimonas sp. HSL3-7]|uniref:L,D-transpeptidase family protein n=1 Tax=Sulfonitrofixus jiaomeiensis TaxID=3131938 RepID=UPI0031F8EF7F
MKYFTKLFLPLFLTFDFACASEQLLLIESNDFNTTHAVLTRYESRADSYVQVGEQIPVNLGRNGLAWGLGESGFKGKAGEPLKQEGDGRSPAGIFTISRAFGYAAQFKTKMPYIQADAALICVDDSQSDDYNTILDRNESDSPKSFEWMKREDDLYKIGLVIEHNSVGKKGAGSCIFFHIQKSEDAPTAGCTAMREEDLNTIMTWLDPAKKPIVVQIPRSYCSQAESLYRGIHCPVK